MARCSHRGRRTRHGGDGRLWDSACAAGGQQPESEAGNIIDIEDALEMVFI
jgi:hypothetical protein